MLQYQIKPKVFGRRRHRRRRFRPVSKIEIEIKNFFQRVVQKKFYRLVVDDDDDDVDDDEAKPKAK